MGRFLVLTVLLIIVIGLALHFEFEHAWIPEWLGRLPGDITIRKGDILLYVPLTSSVLISLVFSLILSLFSEKGK